MKANIRSRGKCSKNREPMNETEWKRLLYGWLWEKAKLLTAKVTTDLPLYNPLTGSLCGRMKTKSQANLLSDAGIIFLPAIFLYRNRTLGSRSVHPLWQLWSHDSLAFDHQTLRVRFPVRGFLALLSSFTKRRFPTWQSKLSSLFTELFYRSGGKR